MRLLIGFGYQKVLFGKGVNVSAVIESLEGARMVTDDYATKTLRPVEDAEFEVKLINEDAAALPDIVREPAFERLLVVQEEKQKLEQKVWQLEARLKKFEDAGKAA